MSTEITKSRNPATGAVTLTIVCTHEYTVITDIDKGQYRLMDEDGDCVMASQQWAEVEAWIFDNHHQL